MSRVTPFCKVILDNTCRSTGKTLHPLNSQTQQKQPFDLLVERDNASLAKEKLEALAAKITPDDSWPAGGSGPWWRRGRGGESPKQKQRRPLSRGGRLFKGSTTMWTAMNGLCLVEWTGSRPGSAVPKRRRNAGSSTKIW